MRTLVTVICIVGVQLIGVSALAGVSSYNSRTGTVVRRPTVSIGRTVSRKPKSVKKQKASGLKMRETLKKKVDVNFGDMDIAEAIRALGQLTSSNIVMGSRAFAEIERKGSPKVNIRLKDVPMEAALSAIVRGAGLNYRVHDHYVFVTSPYRGPNQAIGGTATQGNRMGRGGGGSRAGAGGRNMGSGRSRGRR